MEYETQSCLLTALAGCVIASTIPDGGGLHQRDVVDIEVADDVTDIDDVFKRDVVDVDNDVDVFERDIIEVELEKPLREVVVKEAGPGDVTPAVKLLPGSGAATTPSPPRALRFNTIAVFFLFNARNDDFFYTTSSSERNNAIRNLGYQNRGTTGFIFIDQRFGGRPLYRLYNRRRRQHFYTTSQSERSNAKRNGWNDEGITGYLFSS
ncbi:hypothetical protein D9615_007562 [Tricholomella constricta]|uniref:DUF5648 domain-containing protein n=1 Tax=Tricholomella constricta TaxID=117010 RepID=A0A8H5H7A2_9AGAR|nr:hypothetical protein D9615_007562 [Tricholomella constricta]